MKKSFLFIISSLFLCSVCFKIFAGEIVDYSDIADIAKCLKVIADDKEFYSQKHPSCYFNKFYCAVELLGSIRDNQSSTLDSLITRLTDYPIWSLGLPRQHDLFLSTSLIRIGDSDFDRVLEQHVANFSKDEIYESNFSVYVYLCSLLPLSSVEKIIDDFIERHKKSLSQQKIDNLINYKKLLLSHPNPRKQELFHLSDYTLNHPLYKARQATIKSNIELAQRILKETKNLTSINSETKTKLLAAVDELAKVRAIEAVEILAPIILLQSEKEIDGLD
ncbi:MAG: hypothetical protein LBB88_08920, partial [Planctomycetaceae bacterium]|nr:hypothetical protein [Planctomycetaceae bacterium]